jgi:hypothetical protein
MHFAARSIERGGFDWRADAKLPLLARKWAVLRLLAQRNDF